MTLLHIESLLRRWLIPMGGDLPDIFAVGGAVRDILLRRPSRDVDIVCRRAAQFARDLSVRQNPAAIVVDFSKKKYAPCFRVIRRDRSDEFLDIIEMNGIDLETDLRRRDFTINAMARQIFRDGRLGPVIDPLNGQPDIHAGRIRVCSTQAIPDDPLRIIRAVRLAAELQFTIDPATLQQMKRHVPRLTQCAAERIQSELLIILNCPDSFTHIALMDDIGALTVLVPEIAAMKECRQGAYHHLDVWGHCRETMKYCEQILRCPETVFTSVGPAAVDTLETNNHRPLLKLTALLHDIGKPACGQFLPEKNRMVFYGHARTGREMIAKVADRLRISAAGKEFMMLLVSQHMRPMALARPETQEKTRIRWFRQVADDGLAIMILAVSDILAKAGPKADPEEKIRLRVWADQAATNYLHTLKKILKTANLITGRDLLALGMPPGPNLGKILADIRERQDQGLLNTREAALRAAEKMISS